MPRPARQAGWLASSPRPLPHPHSPSWRVSNARCTRVSASSADIPYSCASRQAPTVPARPRPPQLHAGKRKPSRRRRKRQRRVRDRGSGWQCAGMKHSLRWEHSVPRLPTQPSTGVPRVRQTGPSKCVSRAGRQAGKQASKQRAALTSGCRAARHWPAAQPAPPAADAACGEEGGGGGQAGAAVSLGTS